MPALVPRASPWPSDSDLDMLVEFQPIEPGGLVKASFDLEGQLAAISRQSVDLVMADAIRNPDLQRTNEASKRLIDQAVELLGYHRKAANR